MRFRLSLFAAVMFATIALGAATVLPAQSPSQPSAMSAADQAAIHAILDRQIESWNRHDMQAYVADMTPDVDWVNVVGMWWRGRDQVFAAHDAYHKTIFKTRNLKPWTEVVIRPVTADVAVVTGIGDADGFTSPSGQVFPPSTSILTFVFVKRDGRWWITEAHNTTIDPHAAKSNPVKQ